MSVRKPEFRESSYALSSSLGRIHRFDPASGRHYYMGTVVTRYGIVSIYAEEDYARYDFACRGRYYMRVEYRGRTELGLATEAGKFARRVASSRTGGQQT